MTLLAAGALLLPGLTQAAIIGPYSADLDTLHLWQFDEASGTTASSSLSSGSFSLTAVNGATLGNSSFTGFGNAGSTAGGSDDAFQGSNVFSSDLTGATGAFTFEALINISDTNGQQSIVVLDNSSSNNIRQFQFKIANGELKLTNIGGASGVEDLKAAIPTSGADAFAANEWFHAAVTYNGSEGTSDNLKLYWTKLDATRTVANQIGSFQMDSDLDTTRADPLGVGNEFRGSPGENLKGLIDEVRISGIARSADDMMFAVPEPSTFALLCSVAALGFAAWRRRR